MREASFHKIKFHPYTWICADLQRENSCRNWHVHSKLKRLSKHCVSALTRLFVSKYSETQAVLQGVASSFTNKQPILPQNIWRVKAPSTLWVPAPKRVCETSRTGAPQMNFLRQWSWKLLFQRRKDPLQRRAQVPLPQTTSECWCLTYLAEYVKLFL